MTPLDYPRSLQDLIAQLKRMPGIGSRGAERLALWFLRQGRNEARSLSAALVHAADAVGTCPSCGFFSEEGALCPACSDPTRNTMTICVVEQPVDVLPIERSSSYRGLYHCLGGKISPLDDITPADLTIDRLLERINEHPGCEVILATGSDVDGDATALYLAQLLSTAPCKVTRIAQGMPAGTGLGHADLLTVKRAFDGRQSL